MSEHIDIDHQLAEHDYDLARMTAAMWNYRERFYKLVTTEGQPSYAANDYWNWGARPEFLARGYNQQQITALQAQAIVVLRELKDYIREDYTRTDTDGWDSLLEQINDWHAQQNETGTLDY